MSTAKALRQLLARPRMLVAPGAHDAIGARQIEQAGFEAVYMTGGGTAMAHGFPDFGLLDFSEMAGNALRITRATRLPLIADADTGYGVGFQAGQCVTWTTLPDPKLNPKGDYLKPQSGHSGGPLGQVLIACQAGPCKGQRAAEQDLPGTRFRRRFR
jgi:hypothetical protein